MKTIILAITALVIAAAPWARAQEEPSPTPAASPVADNGLVFVGSGFQGAFLGGMLVFQPSSTVRLAM